MATGLMMDIKPRAFERMNNLPGLQDRQLLRHA